MCGGGPKQEPITFPLDVERRVAEMNERYAADRAAATTATPAVRRQLFDALKVGTIHDPDYSPTHVPRRVRRTPAEEEAIMWAVLSGRM